MVGHDATPASARALARARALGGTLVVLTGDRATPPAGLPSGSVVRRVGRVAPDVIFDVAAELGASAMVVSEAMANPVVVLRPAMLAARRAMRAHDRSHMCLLVVRSERSRQRPRDVDPYRRILVGVDASPGAAVATIAAAAVAGADGAHLDVAAIERRRDSALRDLVDKLEASDAAPSAAAMRRRGPPKAPHLQLALDSVASASVSTHVDFRIGDPTDVLVRASRNDDHDLLVSSTIGVNGHGRQGHVAHVTRRLLRLSRVDHMVVFDAFTLGLADSDAAEDVVRAAAAGLAGPQDVAYGEAAATLHDDDGGPS